MVATDNSARAEMLRAGGGSEPGAGDACSSDDLQDFFENGAIALHIVSGDGTILRANAAELNLLGYPADDYVGHHIAEYHVDQPVIDDILARLRRGETIRRYPARLRTRDGSIRHVEITSSGQFLDGAFVSTRCFTMDVSDLVQAREEARRKDDHLRQVLDALPAAVFMVDAAGVLTYVNEAACAAVGREPRLGEEEWHDVFPLFTLGGERMRREQRPMSIVLSENRPVWGVEVLTQRPDGARVPIITFPTPIQDEHGALTGAVNMFIDISERRRAEERVKLLARELHHRSNNVFAVVQAIVGRSLSGDVALDRARRVLEARLQALARAHRMLSDANWSGLDLSDVVRGELEPFDDRVIAEGPAVVLTPGEAQNFSLVLHELTTNAAKYGALSVPDGQVEVGWSVTTGEDGPLLRFRWRERGGPTVAAPSRKGFGSSLLRSVFRKARVEYPPHGLDCEIEVPLDGIQR